MGVKWNQQLMAQVMQRLERNMQRATAVLEQQIKRRLRKGQAIAKLPGGYKVGVDPSMAGQPPRAVSRTLRKFIQREVIVDGTKVIGRVGTKSKVGRWMERGVKGGGIIRPKRARALIVPIDRRVVTVQRRRKGRVTSSRVGQAGFVFRKFVRKGAIKPRPFIAPAVRASRSRIFQILGASITKIR